MLYGITNPHGGDIYGGGVTLDFSANTNPFGTPEGVIQAVQEALPEMYRYPDPYCRSLVDAIADFEGVDKKFILCGSGAAELIYAYCAAARPKTALELAPTFSEYALGLARVGCTVKHYYLTPDNGFRLDEHFLYHLEDTTPEAVFLCNPNNPTGALIEPQLLKKILDFCKESHIKLFIDECFLDLSDNGQSMKQYLRNYPNLFLLKAFTKSYGMAGIRLGYCLCSDGELLKAMAREVQPWNVSSLAQAAGIAALKETAFLQKTKDLIGVERPWLKGQLEAFGFYVCPSSVNYLLFQGPTDLYTKLKEKGIAIRNCDNYPGLTHGWYRIAVRRHEENEILMTAIETIVKGA
ncbi:MAG: histidinol-phosphate transaminase [Eubacteriales bacterium]|nr:histidinol-phosphate transaminase [Eubacteriales bacterium]